VDWPIIHKFGYKSRRKVEYFLKSHYRYDNFKNNLLKIWCLWAIFSIKRSVQLLPLFLCLHVVKFCHKKKSLIMALSFLPLIIIIIIIIIHLCCNLTNHKAFKMKVYFNFTHFSFCYRDLTNVINKLPFIIFNFYYKILLLIKQILGIWFSFYY